MKELDAKMALEKLKTAEKIKQDRMTTRAGDG